mgnify:CR=1 FL=1
MFWVRSVVSALGALCCCVVWGGSKSQPTEKQMKGNHPVEPEPKHQMAGQAANAWTSPSPAGGGQSTEWQIQGNRPGKPARANRPSEKCKQKSSPQGFCAFLVTSSAKYDNPEGIVGRGTTFRILPSPHHPNVCVLQHLRQCLDVFQKRACVIFFLSFFLA